MREEGREKSVEEGESVYIPQLPIPKSFLKGKSGDARRKFTRKHDISL
jgi:hypothetical protein